jgi:hypothetical protein
MAELLLILILFGDPRAEPLAGTLAETLRTRGGERVRVLTGADANAALKELGVTDGDLIADPAVGARLTSAKRGLVIIRLDRRDGHGTAVFDHMVWSAGRADPVSAIAPGVDDAQAAALAATLKLLDARLPAAATGSSDAPTLSQLAGSADWAGILAVTETPTTARAWYYRIQALSRLGRQAEARTAVAAMAAAFPGQPLTAAAVELVPPVEEPAPATP